MSNVFDLKVFFNIDTLYSFMTLHMSEISFSIGPMQNWNSTGGPYYKLMNKPFPHQSNPINHRPRYSKISVALNIFTKPTNHTYQTTCQHVFSVRINKWIGPQTHRIQSLRSSPTYFYDKSDQNDEKRKVTNVAQKDTKTTATLSESRNSTTKMIKRKAWNSRIPLFFFQNCPFRRICEGSGRAVWMDMFTQPICSTTSYRNALV